MPWWGWLIAVLGGLALLGGIAYVVVLAIIGRGFVKGMDRWFG